MLPPVTEEVWRLGKTALTGYQRAWSPGPPQPDRGIRLMLAATLPPHL
jgi:hypothetical protein